MSAVEGLPNPGLLGIWIERQRQIEKKGFTKEHDDKHIDGELARVAACLLNEEEDEWGIYAKHGQFRIKTLMIAGALVAAEIERVNRVIIRKSYDE